ncbi:hypothetical protein V1507DRAFT_308976 [Lipomyces tetrasporus]
MTTRDCDGSTYFITSLMLPKKLITTTWSVTFRVLQGVVIGTIANVLGQLIVARREHKLDNFQIDYVSIVKFVVYGMAFTPILLGWQAILDKFFPSTVEYSHVSDQEETERFRELENMRVTRDRRNITIST